MYKTYLYFYHRKNNYITKYTLNIHIYKILYILTIIHALMTLYAKELVWNGPALLYAWEFSLPFNQRM